MLRPKSGIFIVGTVLVFGMLFVFPAQASEGIFLKAKNILINGWSRAKDNASFMFNETKRSLFRLAQPNPNEVDSQDFLPIKVYESNQQTGSILDQLRNFLGALKKKTSEIIVIISKPEKQEPTGPMMSAKTSQVVQPTLRDQVKIIVQETRTTTIDNAKVDSLLQDFNKYKETQQKFISELSQVSNVGPRGNVAYTIGNPTFTGTAQGLGDDDIPDDITVSSSKSLSATTISVGTLTNVRIAGSSQFSTIAAALDDLPSTGGTIFIPPNTTLSVSATITINKPNVKILGGGRSSIVRASSGTFNVFTVSADDVVFENFAIEGGATANATTQYGIFTAAGSPALRGQVYNVYFTGADSSTGLNNGMVLDTASNSWKISNNNFNRLIGVISGTGYGVLLGTSHLHSITNNHFTGAAGQGRHAIYVSAGSTYNVVADNIIDAFNESSIVIYSTAAQNSGQFNNVARNTIRNQALGSTGTAAIEITGDSSYNLIEDNVIISVGRHGIAFIDGGNSGLNTDNTARGNKIYQPGQIGIDIEGASRTEIIANSIFNASNSDSGVYSGISIAQGSTLVADQTKVENNIIYGTTHRNAIGLDTTSPIPTNTRIIGNIVQAGVVGDINLNDLAATVMGNFTAGASEVWTQAIGFGNGAAGASNFTLRGDYGRLGLGTTSPFGLVSIESTAITGSNTPIFVVSDQGTSSPFIYVSGINGNVGFGTDSPQATVAISNINTGNSFPALLISAAGTGDGNVAISIDADDVCKDTLNTATCVLNDLAELFGSSEPMEAGDLAIIDTDNPMKLKKATQDKKNLLAGAISTSPAIVFEGSGLKALGGVYVPEENKVPLTLSGRIPVKVNLEGGPIQIGDPITISSIAGVGAKAVSNGKIIGYALESSQDPEVLRRQSTSGEPVESIDGVAKIVVLASLSYWMAPSAGGFDLAVNETGDSLITRVINTITNWFKNAVVTIKEVVADKLIASVANIFKLKIGSADSPAGITLYDTETKQPYCLIIRGGELAQIPGECTFEIAPAGGETSVSNIDGNSQDIGNPNIESSEPASEPAPAPESNSIPETASSPVILNDPSSHPEQSEGSQPADSSSPPAPQNDTSAPGPAPEPTLIP